MLAKLRSSVTNAPPLLLPGHHLVEVHHRTVLRIEHAASAAHARFHELEAGHRHRRLVGGIQLARAGHVHLEAQRRLGADVLDLIERAIRHLHHHALGGDHRLAPLDRETQRARLHDPPLTRVAVHPPRRLAARRHRDPLREQALVVHDGLGPVGLAVVALQHVDQLGVRAMHARPPGRLRLGRQDHQRRLLPGGWPARGAGLSGRGRAGGRHQHR